MKPLARRDIPLLLSALWDAKLWQESIADVHTLEPWHQTPDQTRTVRAANRLAKRYENLHDKIKKANAEAQAGVPAPECSGSTFRKEV